MHPYPQPSIGSVASSHANSSSFVGAHGDHTQEREARYGHFTSTRSKSNFIGSLTPVHYETIRNILPSTTANSAHVIYKPRTLPQCTPHFHVLKILTLLTTLFRSLL